jgi:hypothetical protein
MFTIAESFLHKIKAVVQECCEHVICHEQLEDVLRIEDVEGWRADVLAWETDRSKENPYAIRVQSELCSNTATDVLFLTPFFLEQTQSDVRLALHTKEAALLASESEQILHHQMTPLVYITAGIDLENQQCVLSPDTCR